MSKTKRGKSGVASAQGQKWEQGLMSASFNEEGKWEASLVFVEGDALEDYALIDILAGAVNAGIRKLFSAITKKELYEQVNELGSPKGKKPKEIPQYSEVCESCKMYLDSGDDIPMPLLAKLIKFRLLDIKQKDVKRRESEKRGGAPPPKSAGGKKGDKKERTKSPAKGKGGKKTPEPPSPKNESKLRKRGEEDTDSKYLDDEPDDGPQHYVFISGFHYPQLLGQLDELGLTLDAVVKCSVEDRERAVALLGTLPPDVSQASKDDAGSSEADTELQQIQQASELATFWKDLLLVLQAAPAESRLQDLARLEYTFQAAVMPDSIEDPEKKLEYGTGLFEDLACLVYDLYDWKRQWKNYLEHLRLLNIPLYGDTSAAQAVQDVASQLSATPGAPPAAAVVTSGPGSETDGRGRVPEQVDLRTYNELMNSVPQESASVPLIMHCMLEQVVASEEERDPPGEIPKPPRADGLADALAAHMSGLAFKLMLTDEEQQALTSDFDAPKSLYSGPKQPEMLYFHDQTSHRLNHLEGAYGMDLAPAERDLINLIPLPGLVRLPCPSAKLSQERTARLQELMHFVADSELTPAEIDRAFKQFVFECMELSSVDANGNIRPSAGMKQDLIPWDDPYPYFKGTDDVDIAALVEEGLEAARSATSLSTGSLDPSAQKAAPESTAPVDATVLKQELEAVAPPKSASSRSSSPKSGRSRTKKRGRKGSANKEKLASSPVPEPVPALPVDTERPNSGILKSPARSRSGSANSRKSSQSVHFEHDDEGHPLPQPGDEGQKESDSGKTSTSHTIEDVELCHKRNLDQWCFAEHLEPSILQQVMVNASYSLPYVDTYYHRRDHSLLVVMHNPSNAQLTNRMTWETKLHSNVGFRNYLEHIAGSIQEWTQEQDAKHEASLLAKEVVQIQKDGDAAGSRPGTGQGKKGRERSKSPKKAASRRSGSRGSSAERPASTNLLVREGSLKAQKEELDRLKQEAEDAEKAVADKRAKSAQKKASAAKEEKEKKPNSRSSSKSRLGKEVVEPTEAAPVEEPQKEEEFWPFTGYDVGNNLIHMHGEVTTMFPADGAQICTEKVDFVQGVSLVKTSVRKDGHLYHVHVVDPKVPEDKPEEVKGAAKDSDDASQMANPGTVSDEPTDAATELTVDADENDQEVAAGEEAGGPSEPPRPVVGQFGSFNAQFNDGMSLAFSIYGNQGECEEGKKYEPVVSKALQTPRSPSPVTKESPTKDKTKGKGKAVTPDPSVSHMAEEEGEGEQVVEEPPIVQSFQRLYLTCPDGLCVTYFLESGLGVTPESADDRHLVVRQSYPFKTSGQQECESSRGLAHQESSRLITSNGTVVKFMTDGNVILLFANGQVSELSNFPLPSSRSSSPQRAGSARSQNPDTPTKKGRRQKSAKDRDVADAAAEEDPLHKSHVITTLASGQRIGKHMDGTPIDVKDVLIAVASDPQTHQSLHSRDDHVVTVLHPDQTSIVEHSDGTRITTYVSQMEVLVEEPDSAETGEEPRTEIQEVHLIRVECPGYATVKFDGTKAGWCCTEFGNRTVVNVLPCGLYNVYHHDGTFLQVQEDGTCVVQPRPNNVQEVHDSSHELKYILKHFDPTLVETVDNEGNHFMVTNTGSSKCTVAEEPAEDTAESTSDEPPLKPYKQHAPRFFIVHPDCSGTELLRYQDVAEYLEAAEDDPMTAILTDPLTDHPGVLGITVLKPNLKDMSAKWLSSYVEDTIIPPGLTSRDLKTLPAKEVVQDGPQFGHNVGKGLAIGTAVAPPPKLPVLRCPTVLELRQIIQYKPISEELRSRSMGGLREYAEYVLAREADSEALLVQDPRSEEEKEIARQLQELLNDKSSCTGKISGDVKCLYEKAAAPKIPSPPPAPQPKRTSADWERDSREINQELENRKALREHQVPSYFESEMGKAFLLSQAPDMAALARELAENRAFSETMNTASPPSSPPMEQPQGADIVAENKCSSHIVDTGVSPPGGQGEVYSPSLNQGGTGTTPSALRPGNPTPGHGMGNGSPAPLRPINPTPNHANKAMEDRPVLSPEEPSSSDPAVDRGQPLPVRLPPYFHGGRPGAHHNQKFYQTEDPVRRRVFTSSLAGVNDRSRAAIGEMRGFELLPMEVNFGVLKEGNTYAFTVCLKNAGIDACRFKVRQPPPSTGLKVHYTPGPVAAGLKAEIKLELYAIAVGVEGESGVGGIDYNIEITTETDYLYLPVSAVVLTAHEYEQQGKYHTKHAMAPGVRFITDRAPGSHGIIRPHRQGKGIAV